MRTPRRPSTAQTVFLNRTITAADDHPMPNGQFFVEPVARVLNRIRYANGASRPGNQRVWTLTAAIWAAAFVSIWGWVVPLGPPSTTYRVPWLIMVAGFFVAESAVIHLQFRRDAHSFSMNEVPLIVGLFFLNPLELISAQFCGYLAALVIVRRQAPVKLAFNLGQFSVQAVVAILVFRAVVGSDFSPGLGTAVAAGVSALAALWVAHGLVVAAILASGGTESLRETAEVLALSSAGTVMNAVMATGAVAILHSSPDAAWLGIAPPLFLYLAYRAYSAQRTERARISSLFEATKSLHKTPELESSIAVAGRLGIDLVKAESIAVLLFGKGELQYLSTIGPGTSESIMKPVAVDLDAEPWLGLRTQLKPVILTDGLERLETAGIFASTDAIAVHLSGETGLIGLMLATDRLGDVSGFNQEDARILATLGSQLAVTLENSRLADNLAEVNALKTRLEEVVRSKDQLIASVSHELRTPLTGIIGLAAILQETLVDQLDPDSAEMLGMVVEQATELSNIIEDLLAQAKAENGSLRVIASHIDLAEEVTSLLSMSSSSDIPVKVLGAASNAYADPMRLRQILRNLLTNATRYGGDQVWVEVDTKTEFAILRICDNGVGVPEEMAGSIFEPYRSAHEAKVQPGSVGLGLAVSRTIARLMGGDLRYAKVGDITVFTLILPRRSPVEQSASAAR